MSFHHDIILEDTQFHTYKQLNAVDQSTNRSSRIDMVWVLDGLLLESFAIKSYTQDYINTDHDIVIVNLNPLNLFNVKSQNYLRNHPKLSKPIYRYDLMDDTKWHKYQEELDQLIQSSKLNDIPITDQHSLNKCWDLTRD